MAFNKQNIGELLAQFKTDASAGLTNELAVQHYTTVGPNKITGTASRKWWKIMFSQFKNLLVIPLIVANLFSFQFES